MLGICQNIETFFVLLTNISLKASGKTWVWALRPILLNLFFEFSRKVDEGKTFEEEKKFWTNFVQRK